MTSHKTIGLQVVNMNYCKRIIFSVYDIWRNFNFWLFSVDLNWRFILINLIIPKYRCTFSDVLDLADGYDRQRR